MAISFLVQIDSWYLSIDMLTYIGNCLSSPLFFWGGRFEIIPPPPPPPPPLQNAFYAHGFYVHKLFSYAFKPTLHHMRQFRKGSQFTLINCMSGMCCINKYEKYVEHIHIECWCSCHVYRLQYWHSSTLSYYWHGWRGWWVAGSTKLIRYSAVYYPTCNFIYIGVESLFGMEGGGGAELDTVSP